MLDLGAQSSQEPGLLHGGHASLGPQWPRAKPRAKLLRMLEVGA